MKKVLPHTDMELEKGGNILIAFSDRCGYSLKLQIQQVVVSRWLIAMWNLKHISF